MKLLFTFAIFCIAFRCFSQTDTTPIINKAVTAWRYCTSSENGDKWYIRANYESVKNGKVKIWIKAVYPTYTVEGKTYKNITEKTLYVFDCKEKQSKGMYSVLLLASGALLYEQPYERDWEVVVPDTVFESVFEKVCELYGN